MENVIRVLWCADVRRIGSLWCANVARRTGSLGCSDVARRMAVCGVQIWQGNRHLLFMENGIRAEWCADVAGGNRQPVVCKCGEENRQLVVCKCGEENRQSVLCKCGK
jgi:hypothetical protein